MQFQLPARLVNAGKAVYNAGMRVSLLQAKIRQGILDLAATDAGKSALLLIPKYGKVAALAAGPVRDLHRHALHVHEAVAKGENPGSIKEFFQRNLETFQEHLPSITGAHREYKLAKAAAPTATPA